MSLQSPENFPVDALRTQVLATYTRVALAPDGDFHFHRGPAFAAGLLGYDAAELASLPATATARFAGVGNPLRAAAIAPGATVLDLGCGAGTDLLLAARHVGPGGRAIGVDVNPEMRACAIAAAREAGLSVEVRAGLLEELPVETGSVDVVISNGVINLVPDKLRVFREIRRVLRPGGRVQIADVAVRRELKPASRQNPELWAACIAGALTEAELVDACLQVGLHEAWIAERFPAFRGTVAEGRVSEDLEVRGVNLLAQG